MRRCLVLVCLLLPGTALAQSSSAPAESLFREGKALMTQKRYDDACPKLEESQRLDASSGTALALGVCWEATGKIASAWGSYINAASLARKQQRPDYEKLATAKADAVEPKVPHLAVGVADKPPGFEIRIDGTPLGAAAWSSLPIDAGEHTIDAHAPGKKDWTKHFTISGSMTRVDVPALESEPIAALPTPTPAAPPLAPAAPPPKPVEASSLGTIGAVTTVIGAVGIGAGFVFGGLALSKKGDATGACAPSCADNRNADAVAQNNSAKQFADISTVAVIAGGVLLATGVTLLVLAPSRKTSTTAVLTTNGAYLRGTF